MKSNEPQLRDMQTAIKLICALHGPRRYDLGSSQFNGAISNLESRFAFAAAKTLEELCQVDPWGEGAVWGWYAGSPRVFQWGFTRSKGAAVAKMNRTLAQEFRLATGKELKRHVRSAKNDKLVASEAKRKTP